jgi:hypothetical protein
MKIARPAKFGFHAILLASAVALTLSLRLAFGSWYAEQSRQVAGGAWTKGSRELGEQWRKFAYTDVRKAQFASEFLDRIQWNTLELSEAQISSLRTRVAETIVYLQNPTFAEYYRLKTEGLHFSFRPRLGSEPPWTNAMAASSRSLPTDAAEAARAMWTRAHTQSGQLKPPRVAAVCLENVAAAMSLTNTGWSLLGGKVAKGLTAALEAPNPGFEYTGTGTPSGQGPESKQLYFHFSFFAKVEGSDSAGPVYISLAWLPQDQSWGLSRLIADRRIPLRTVF